MKQTLLLIRSLHEDAQAAGRNLSLPMIAALIESNIPAYGDERLQFFLRLAEFLVAAIGGVVLDPESWD